MHVRIDSVEVFLYISIMYLHLCLSVCLSVCLLLSGVYELRRYRTKAGTIPLWAHRFQQGAEERFSISAPLGIWFSEFGPLNTSESIFGHHW